jgi:hypothetical protein
MLVTAWPLPSGTCLFPRLLSNAADAPYVGEAAILFNLTRLPAEGVPIQTGGALPGFVLIFLGLQLGFGLLLLIAPILSLYRWRKQRPSTVLHQPGIQVGIWVGLLVACALCLCLGKTPVALLFLACAQLFPRYQRKRMSSPEPSAIKPAGA